MNDENERLRTRLSKMGKETKQKLTKLDNKLNNYIEKLKSKKENREIIGMNDSIIVRTSSNLRSSIIK